VEAGRFYDKSINIRKDKCQCIENITVFALSENIFKDPIARI
jgi:hypothetical protein